MESPSTQRGANHAGSDVGGLNLKGLVTGEDENAGGDRVDAVRESECRMIGRAQPKGKQQALRGRE